MTLRDARRLVSLIALGCLLGAATVAGSAFVSAAPAAASCTTAHENVEAQDLSSGHYGNRGNIYVNTDAVIDSLQDSLYRSVLILYDIRNYVEVGWGAGPNNITGNSGPTVFANWRNSGTLGHVIYKSLSVDQNYTFTVENAGQVFIFRFYFDSESSPFAYSPTMIFQSSTAITNSEHYNTCDSLYTHMYGLNYFSVGGVWRDWGDLECYSGAVPGWYLYKNSNTELHVYSGSGGLC